MTSLDAKQADSYATRLKQLDSCAVSDALDKLGLAGVAVGIVRIASSQRIAGRVLTVQLGVGAPASGKPRHLGTTAIEAAQPGEIIVVEQTTGIYSGCWGGILSLGAKLRGVAGMIADGLVRDVDDATQLDFPVFARGATPVTARGRVGEVANNQPVTIAGVKVQTGDYAIADGSGVVFIAAADIARVLDAAEAISAAEAAMARSLREGKPITEVMGASYEHMLRR